MTQDRKFEADAFGSFNWFNILPNLHGKRIAFCSSCSSEKDKQVETALCLHGATIKYIDLFAARENIRTGSITQNNNDICIMDTSFFLTGNLSLLQFKENLRIVYELLNDHGLLLLSFPRGLRVFRFKFFSKKFLQLYGFETIRSFFCIPSCIEPFAIYSFSDDQGLTSKLFSALYLEPLKNCMRLKRKVINVFKYLCARFTCRFNPFAGIMVVAYKSQENNLVTHIDELLGRSVGEYYKTNQYYTVWLAKSAKYIGLFYGGKKKELFAVCKRSFVAAHRSNCIQEEHDKLTLLSSYHDEFKMKKIQVPAPIYFECDRETFISIESPIYGKPLENYKWRLTNKKLIGNFTETLDELVNIQIYLQNNLSTKHGKDFPKLSKRYFINTLDILHIGFNDTRRIDSYASCVQHGDFTDINIIYNSKDKLWGIIDWEWSASGFPFLFDLFYLFFSLEFREKKRKNETQFLHHFNSFSDSFFHDNWYSNYIKGSIVKYCTFFSLNVDNVFDYFLDFLLFHYNKYKDDYNSYDYANLYRKSIMYSIENQDKFII